MLLKLRWEGPALWKSVWTRVKTMIPWGEAERQPLLTLGKISIKAGETQERYSFTWKRSDIPIMHLVFSVKGIKDRSRRSVVTLITINCRDNWIFTKTDLWKCIKSAAKNEEN